MRRATARLLTAFLVLAGGLFVVVLGTLLSGGVSGEEFAPDTFEHRAFVYFELPLLHIQVSPVRRFVERLPLARLLVDQHYIATKNPPSRWDFVVSHRLGEISRRGDARILSGYLGAWDPHDPPRWQVWTTEHPAMAKILWPAIAKLAQQELYLFIPDVFALATEGTEADAFESDLKRLLARRYEELGHIEAELANFPAAVRFFTEALGYDPDRETSIRGRAAAREAMGQSTAEQPDTWRSSPVERKNPAS
jgi:hypothetical protein